MNHFGDYVQRTIMELYAPLPAALEGTLDGPGTLGTVLLCETLLSFLPNGFSKFQPTKLLNAYSVTPLSVMQTNKRLDLTRHATLEKGCCMYHSLR